MDLPTIGWIFIAFFLVLMFLNMPVGIALIFAGFLGLLVIRGMSGALGAIGFTAWRQGINDILLVIPLFTWMGMLGAAIGMSRDAFSSIYKWVGHLPGGLAMACVFACAGFGAISGNQMATVATMNQAVLPEMRKYRYEDAFSLGCIAGSANIDTMIPPSGALVLYGFITETSIGDLFIAAIIPGILISVLMCVQIYIQVQLRPAIAPLSPHFTWSDRLVSLKGLWSIVLVFLAVMGGIYFGIFTPSEGAAVGVFIVLLVGLANRELTWKKFTHSLSESVLVGAMIMLMIIGAMTFATFTTASEIPQMLTKILSDLAVNPYIVMGAILIVYLVAGCILDIFAVLVITLPIFFPIVTSLGFNPLHFGVMSTLTIMMGCITPPFGIVVFAMAGMNRDIPLYQIFKGVMPFLYSMIVALIILLLIPEISTFLPKSAYPYR